MRLVARIAFLALLSVVPACGGSSSETPPPLEPEFDRATPASSAGGRHVVQQGAPRGDESGDEIVAPADTAPSTWGGSDAGARGRY